MPTRAPPVNRNPQFTSADFNSWVIGGQYTKNTLKRGQLQLGLPQADVSALEHHRHNLESRKEQLRQELDAHSATYVPKVATAMRNATRASSRERDSNGTPRQRVARSPTREHHRGEGDQADGGAPNDDNSSSALRGRLKASFAQITATHAYGTLFPPLLTPYNRACLLGQATPTVKSPHQDNQIPDAFKTAVPTGPRSHNTLSVVAGERKRSQPSSGPKAFFPNGSNSVIYRHFMHIPPAERGTFAVGSRDVGTS